MSNISQIIDKLDKFMGDDSLPLKDFGGRIIEDLVRDDDFGALVEKYPELNDIANGSDLEWQGDEQDRQKIRKTFDELKNRASTE